MKKRPIDSDISLEQLDKIAEGLAETFAPIAEVVLHDLRTPHNAIRKICNNLSRRKEGDPSTELGLARIHDPDYPQIITNYRNRFSDGREVKSSSIGIKNREGRYVAALCINVDLTLLNGLGAMLEKLTQFNEQTQVKESLVCFNDSSLHQRIDQYVKDNATTIPNLTNSQKQEIVGILKDEGFLNIKKAAVITTDYLQISRATFYNYLKK